MRPMESIVLVLAMLLAVVASGYLVRVLPFPVPLPLVQIALGAMIAGVFKSGIALDPEVFFLLFLPPLLFLDGWRIPNYGLLRDKGTILELALGLVVFTVVGMGFLIHWMIPAMPLPVAFALAAIVSPTDALAVSSIAARTPMPRRLLHILQGESLLNDASGLVCFRFAVAAAMTGTFSLASASLTFALDVPRRRGHRRRLHPGRDHGPDGALRALRRGDRHADPGEPAAALRRLPAGRAARRLRHPRGGGRGRHDELRRAHRPRARPPPAWIAPRCGTRRSSR